MNAATLSAIKDIEKLLVDIKTGKKTVVAVMLDHFGKDEQLTIRTQGK